MTTAAAADDVIRLAERVGAAGTKLGEAIAELDSALADLAVAMPEDAHGGDWPQCFDLLRQHAEFTRDSGSLEMVRTEGRAVATDARLVPELARAAATAEVVR